MWSGWQERSMRDVSSCRTDMPWHQELIAITMNTTIVWGVTPCSLVEVEPSFLGRHCLHLHGRRVSQQATNKNQVATAIRDTGTWSHGAKWNTQQKRDITVAYANRANLWLITQLITLLPTGNGFVVASLTTNMAPKVR
jgi:hypothetical protein